LVQKKLGVVLLDRSKKIATQSFADTLLLDRSFFDKKLGVVPLDRSNKFAPQSFADTLLLDRSFFDKKFGVVLLDRAKKFETQFFADTLQIIFQQKNLLEKSSAAPGNSGSLGLCPSGTYGCCATAYTRS